MPGDDRDRREVAVDPQILDRIADAAAPRPDAGDEKPGTRSEGEAGPRAEAIAMIALAIETRLTRRQREIVNLYFYAEKTQQEIAEILGISQQVVSRQLFGVVRKGRKVGGAIRRLRGLMRDAGIHFD